ncbi:hypothetical protein [Streptomyces cupreus]|uniref:hypothetical protein n=1 Tax=Streptomyces cupreus TaxID=2759956 RepID=UPI00300DA81A
MDWQRHARRLAAATVRPESRWFTPLATTPRHVFVPRWWTRRVPAGWELCDGPADPDAWMQAAYADRTLVTRIGPAHAPRARPARWIPGGQRGRSMPPL